MAGSLNLADTLAGAYTGFKQGAFNDNNQWVSGLAAAQQGLFDDNSPMNDSAGYNYVEPGIPDIFKPATSSANLPYNSDLPMENTTVYGPQNFNSGLDPFNQPSNYYSPYDGWNSDLDPFNQEENYTYTTTSAPNNSPNTGGGGGGASSYSAPQAEAAYLNQDLSQRTPSGTQYAPDLSAYNDSSLFNYDGTGVGDYIYGQGLRTDGADYSIWGTPTDMVNPYYEGQFKPQGPADAAINMPAVELPEGVQPVSADVSMPGFTGSGNQIIGGSLPTDLTYQQTIDEMGIFGPNNPPPSTLFPSPGGASTPANMGLTERQIAQMSPQQQAYMTQILADQDRMQQGQLGFGTAPAMDDTLDVEAGMQRAGNYGLTMPIGDNLVGNEAWGQPGILSAFSENDEGMVDARRNYLFNRDLDLGRPGDASYEEFVADPSLFTTNQRPDQGVAAQAMADQMMAGLTKEELRDGLFIEPNVSTGKMGIPDIFTQDKTPIEAKDASLFDSDFEFDPDNPYLEQDITDGFLWQDNNGNYHRQWDDMGLIDVIPGMNDPEFLRGEALTESRNQALAAEQAKQDKIAADANQARAEQAQREQEIYAREQMAAREEVVQRNIAEARALAEEQARVAADRKVFQDRMAANRKDAARVPVYTAPKAAPTPAPRPTAPAGGYSTKSVNNNFATRRDVRNLFA